jgi:hypothetical protein
MRVSRITITLAAVLLSAGSSLAQNRKPLPLDEQNKYVVSARAGVVSLVEGRATAKGEANPTVVEVLAVGDELRMSDTVATGAGSRIEILLNPGCYLRLGENSEFVFLFDGFTSNKVKLLRGSAVLEASAVDGFLRVETPKAKFDIVREGLYRFNVAENGKSEVAVRKGRALAGKTSIKGGKRAIVEGETVVLASFNKKEADELDDWSKDRARTLIASNRQLSNSLMRRSLYSLVGNSWVYDPFCRCYTFLPYTQGFSSPYGWSYAVCNPYWWHYGPRNNRGWSGGGDGGGNSGGQSGGGSSGGGQPSGGGGSHGGGGGSVHVPPPTTPPSRSEPRGVDRERPAPRRP